MNFTQTYLLGPLAILLSVTPVVGQSPTPPMQRHAQQEYPAETVQQWREMTEAYLTSRDFTWRKQQFKKIQGLVVPFAEKHPAHEATPEMLRQRWLSYREWGATLDEAVREMDVYAEKHPGTSLSMLANYCKALELWRAEILMDEGEERDKIRQRAAEAAHKFVDDHGAALPAFRLSWTLPRQEDGADLLMRVGHYFVPDSPEFEALEAKLNLHFPRSFALQKMHQLKARRELVGKEFELKFEDALTGKHVNIENFRDKVVVLKVWDLGCERCFTHEETIQKIEKELGDRVQIIGVVQNDGEEALERIRTHCRDRELAWPQWQMDRLSRERLGILGVPAYFVIDKDGVLVETEKDISVINPGGRLIKEVGLVKYVFELAEAPPKKDTQG